MKMIALMLALLFGAVGCSSLSPACFLKDKFAVGVTEFVVEKGQCEKPSIVYERNVKLMEQLGLCKPKTGPIADAVCRPVTTAVVEYIVGGGLEAAYPGAGCKGTLLKQDLTEGLTGLCEKIPVKYCPKD